MKFCMLTTFFGAHSFGGDAAFVDRLSRAWRGTGTRSTSSTAATPSSSSGATRPLGRTSRPRASRSTRWRARSGRSRRWRRTRRAARSSRRARSAACSTTIRPDVVHFHNLSLIGGPGLLGDADAAAPSS